MIRDCKTCSPSSLLKPARLLEELQRRGLLVPGPDVVIVVTNDREERVLGLAMLPDGWSEDDFCFGEPITAAILSAGGKERAAGPCDKTVVLVRRREGRTVPLTREMDGWIAWLNGHQGTDVYAGDWLLVTDHGWRSLLTHTGPAGLEPRLSPSQVLRLA